MAVLGRLLISSAERLDLPDLLSIDSYAAGDWRFFLKGLVGSDTPYVLKGFDVIDPQNAIGSQSCAIRVADSAVFYPGSQAGSFFYGLPEGNSNSEPLVPELRKNATNYVYLTFSTFNTSADSRSFWDPDKDAGAGGEFSQDVNTESVLQVQVGVSTGSFPTNTIPVAIINVGPVVITSIQDARDMLFRLGSGGISPNPFNTYSFRSLPDSSYEREEPPTTMVSPSDPNPFQGADKNIETLKEWMDVVMTKLLELGGTNYWYESTESYSLIGLFADALATTVKSKGQWQHSSATAGLLTWTEDLQIKSANSPKDIIIRAGNKTLSNEQVAFLNLSRNQSFNNASMPVAWTNGQNYVNTINGAVGLFSNLSQGDWVKTNSDNENLFLRVEQFYDSVNLGGSTTTAALAKSIRLSSTYQGSTTTALGVYDKGVYQTSDVQVADRSNTSLTAAGGNLHWLALRSDTIQNISSISTLTISGTISSADGSVVTVSSTAHGLSNGDYIHVSAPAGQVGNYIVEVEDANTFTYNSTNTSTGSLTAYYALATTTTRDNGYGLQLESANHGFSEDDTIIVAGTTSYNGSFSINKRSATQFQFAVSSSLSSESAGTATLAKIQVRSEDGLTKIVQGESIDVGGPESQNIMSFIGMKSASETHPTYLVPLTYNTLRGQANYNSLVSDSLTDRVSKLTAMMSDKAQDKTIGLLPENVDTVTNTTSGSNQIIDFSGFAGSPILNVVTPSSSGGVTANLSGSLTLATNECAYFTLTRNNTSTISDLSGLTVSSITSVPLDENVYIFAFRLSSTAIWLWNGKYVPVGTSPMNGGSGSVLATFYDPLTTNLSSITGIAVTEDGISVQDKDTVLFSNLSSGNNRIYKATVSGGIVTAWTAQGLFSQGLDPIASESVRFKKGTAFAQQLAVFNGSTWTINDVVRYFSGTDWWEQSSLKTSSIADATSNGTIFSVSVTGSENWIVDYSLVRGSSKETGTIYMTSDGTNVNVTTGNTYIGDCKVTFSGDINAGNIRLLYTSEATGDTGTMKYTTKRWSNSPGGPAGPVNYSVSPGGSGGAAGTNGDIQFNSSNLLAGNSNFKIDTANGTINLNGLNQTILSSSLVLTDNTASPTAVVSYSATANPFVVVEYSVQRNNSYRVGRLLISNDGASGIGFNDDYVETTPSGVAFSALISGSNVMIMFTTTATGFNGSLKYSMRRWS